MKRILLIGQHGQVSTYLQRAFREQGKADIEVVVANRQQLDLSKPAALATALAGFKADMIINPAAYTAVDLAEEEADLAYLINRDAVAEIAKFSAQAKIPLLHFSTDYVFPGNAKQPYQETDQTAPTGVYGASKLAGEQAILSSDAAALILRTSWVYSNHGKNFYKTMLALAETRDELSVVADQFGSPTYAGSIAMVCKQLAERILLSGGINQAERGVYHFSCQGATSWHEFAQRIFSAHGKNQIKVHPITTKDFPTPAQRPAYSVLNNQKLQDVFELALPAWERALSACVAESEALDREPQT